MKVHLERANARHVQTFALDLGPEDQAAAVEAGFASPRVALLSMLVGSREAFAMVRDGQVLAMAGVFQLRRGGLWLHTAPAFKAAGFGALRVARLLIDRLVVDHGELTIDVDAGRPELVRMADWLGFKARGSITRFGRPFHCCVLRRAA